MNSDSNYNIFEQCEAYNCSDDGFDMYGGSYCQLISCLAHDSFDSAAGEQNGFKMGDYQGTMTNNTADRCIAWENGKNQGLGRCGFVGNGGNNVTFTNCTAYDNHIGFAAWNPEDATTTFRNCGAWGNVQNTDIFGAPTEITNSWNVGTNTPDFVGVDDSNWDTFLAIQATGDWDDLGTDVGYGDDIGALQVGETLNELMDIPVAAATYNLSFTEGIEFGDFFASTVEYGATEGGTTETIISDHKYIVELHDSSGDLVAVLDNAYAIAYSQNINLPFMLQFAIPADDEKVSNITLANEIWLRDYDTQIVVRKFRLQKQIDSRE